MQTLLRVQLLDRCCVNSCQQGILDATIKTLGRWDNSAYLLYIKHELAMYDYALPQNAHSAVISVLYV